MIRVDQTVDLYERKFARSRELAARASNLFPQGVTHDLRHLTPFPVYIEHAEGARKWDVDGNEIVDLWMGHGSLLLGHSHPRVVQAVQQQASRATHPGGSHDLEVKWGEWVQHLVPCAERIRFVSSGTEATLMALRLARIHTGKPRILKFAGHFHGWHDFVMPGADFPFDAQVPGVPGEHAASTVIVPPNRLGIVEDTLKSDPQIGTVILEPTGGHFGSVPIGADFLTGLREITSRLDRLLIFDEVISGFRVDPGGAQRHYNVTPDLATYAKVLAGGLPGGCVAGRSEVMSNLELRPGKVKMRHPGTFNANPLSAAAGSAALKIVATGEPCEHATNMGRLLRTKLNEMFAQRSAKWIAYGEFSGLRLLANYDGPRSMSDGFVPHDSDPEQLEGNHDRELMHAFRRGMLLNGVDLPGFWGMTSAAHQEADIDKIVDAVSATLDLLDAD